MPKEIWNEGRVVGLSAYEIYIREFLENNPGEQPASEREWLASSLALGASMLVKVPVASGSPRTDYSLDIPFPTGSRLCAANTIIGSFFHGNAEVGSDGYWATKVTDYGELISNTASSSPSNLALNPTIPTRSSLVWTSTEKNELRNYLKIVDGVILQPGSWSVASSHPPQKDMTPDMSAAPTLRLHILDELDTPFWLLLTGFSIRTVVTGETGIDGSIDTDSPEDGDFLGPQCFPWANKVVFSTPMAAIQNVLGGQYTRTIDPTGSSSQTASDDDSPMIDLLYQSSYFTNVHPEAKISYTVSSLDSSGSGSSVLLALPRRANGIRGLYLSRVTGAGNATVEPADCHAPGTVKLFEETLSSSTQNQHVADWSAIPGAQLLWNNPNDSAQMFQATVKNGLLVWRPVAQVNVTRDPVSLGTSTPYVYNASVNTGTKTTRVLSLVDNNGNVLDVSGSGTPYTLSAINNGNLNWAVLQAALGNNKSIDILGTQFKQLRTAIANNLVAGKQFAICLVGGEVVIQEVAALPNFFFSSLKFDMQNYSTDVYSGVRIDLFGFSDSDATTTNVVSSFGTLTVSETSPEYSSSGNNWFQSFRVNSAYQAAFDTLVSRLNPASQTVNMVKIVCMPVPGYKATSGDVNNGAPISNTPNLYIGYVNITNGTTAQGQKYDGILYVRNGSNTNKASSTGLLCSLNALNMTMRPSCKRQDGPTWTI